jgi:large subunit ribosomal protein L2
MLSVCAKFGRLAVNNEFRQNPISSLGAVNKGCDLLSGGLLPSISQVNFTHNHNRDLRTNFKFKRERPIGPNKAKPQNLIPDIRVARTVDYHKKVHYPLDGLYTTKKLPMTKRGGRHPETGMKVIEGVGGGSKRKWRWIDSHRLPTDWPRDGPVLEERVLGIYYDPNQDAKIALTGYDDKLRWQVATSKLQNGDLIRTFTDIPKNPVKPKEGDSHPVGALPLGTTICQIEMWPGEGAFFAVKAENEAKIVRRINDRIVIKCWDRLEFAIPEACQCVVGVNSIHPLRKMIIGSPNRMRWLGIRPRSGLWKRKDGRRGRKIKKMPPAIYTTSYEEYMKDVGTPMGRAVKGKSVVMTIKSEGKRGQKPARKRQTLDGW